MTSIHRTRKSACTALDKIPNHQENHAFFDRLENADLQLEKARRNRDANPAEIRYWSNQYESARTDLILANQGLVGSIARRYQGFGLDYTDLVSEGNIGLMKAIHKFDAGRGTQFSSYAYIRIKGAITRALCKQGRTIRIPEHQLTTIRLLKKTSEELQNKLKCEISMEMLAWEVNFPVEKVRALLAMENLVVSLDSHLDQEGRANSVELIADEGAHDPSLEADAGLRAEWLRNAMRNLSEREQEVLVRRYGIKDGRGCNREEIAEKIGVSRERIRQIQIAAQSKILHFHKAGRIVQRPNATTISTEIPKSTDGQSKPAAAGPKMSRIRARSTDNLDHHLWNNNGTWFCKFRYTDGEGRIQAVNKSLKTKVVDEARIRRDQMMAAYEFPSHLDAA